MQFNISNCYFYFFSFNSLCYKPVDSALSIVYILLQLLAAQNYHFSSF